MPGTLWEKVYRASVREMPSEISRDLGLDRRGAEEDKLSRRSPRNKEEMKV